MGDILCRRCGEPWDAYGVTHGDMTALEARRFRAGKGCPVCWKARARVAHEEDGVKARQTRKGGF